MTVLASLACVVSAAGIARPSYADIYETLQARFQSIYGTDAYIEEDSQDGQLLAVFAKAIDDANATAVMVYNAYSPTTAQGQALSNNVKINGITRNSPTPSTVDLLVSGTPGTVLDACVAGDDQGRRWALPLSVTIPSTGEITVTATAEFSGAISAEAETINEILTPTLGWSAVINPDAATPGAPVESDADLRRRQADAVALPSQTVLAGILAAVQDLDGVVQAVIYENDTNTTDALGLPPHSISLVVDGGDSQEIAEAIAAKKTPGAYTHGNTSVVVVDDYGIPSTIRYYTPEPVETKAAVTIKALPGYTSGIGTELKQAIADYVNGLAIGKRIDYAKLYLPAQLFGAAHSETYEVNVLQIGLLAGALGTTDIEVAFNQVAELLPENITLTETT